MEISGIEVTLIENEITSKAVGHIEEIKLMYMHLTKSLTDFIAIDEIREAHEKGIQLVAKDQTNYLLQFKDSSKADKTEQIILGVLLTDGNSASDLLNIIEADEFRLEFHKRIYHNIKKVFATHGSLNFTHIYIAICQEELPTSAENDYIKELYSIGEQYDPVEVTRLVMESEHR